MLMAENPPIKLAYLSRKCFKCDFRQQVNVRVRWMEKSSQLVVNRKQEVRVVCGAWAARCWEHGGGAVVGLDQQPAHLPQLVSGAASPGNWGLSAEEVALSGQSALWRPPVSLKTGDRGNSWEKERDREREWNRGKRYRPFFFLYITPFTGWTNYR